MNKHNQDGAVSGVGISLILTVLLLVGAIGFGAWAYQERQKYKTNTDALVAVAVDAAKQAANAAKEKDFLERVKQPYKTYQGPDATGSLVVVFPKTWSGYVDDSGSGAARLDGYFAPGVVPPATNPNSIFALRLQVVEQSYDKVLESFVSQQRSGKLNISVYALPKLPQIVGVQVKGELSNKKTVTMVVLPLRADTLQIWTEGSQYLHDFNTDILPNVSFSP